MGAQAILGGEQGIDLAEACTCDWKFVRTVVNVTQMSEEGVFRHVVLFL